MAMRIGIIGAGAIGSVVGGMLTKAGHDVTLIDQWPEHVETMRKNGLRLSGTCGDHTVRVKALHIYEAQAINEPFDAVFIAVKSYDTEWATSLGVQYLKKPNGVVVDFQNGINDERVAAIAGRERTLGSVITIGAGMYEPGHAMRTDTGSIGFKIGGLDGKGTERARARAKIMECGRGADVAAEGARRGGGRPSLLQDVMRGRRTEIDYLNGYVCEQGRRRGIKTPVNDAIVEAVRSYGVGRLKPDPKNLEPILKVLPKR